MQSLKDLVKKALDVLNGDLPDSGDNCDYCKWKDHSLGKIDKKYI